MPETILIGIVGIIVLGVGAQWLAWRIGLPSILLLLTFGLIAGPVLGWIDPNKLFGDDLLFPVVSLAVALILYEGGLSLRISELPKVGAVVRNLVSLGALVTWGIGALAAHLLLGLDASLSALLGAILVVTGPTVIGPLLRQIRPTGNISPILKWEGIVIDPIGALLAVLIFEALMIGEAKEAAVHIAFGVLKTIVLGGGIGLAAAGLLVLLLARYWIADYLQNAASLMLVVAAFAISNKLQPESGLLAATVMGFALANQKRVDVGHIVEFKENLRVLLISSLFIVLAARLQLAELGRLAPRGLLFVAVLILIARPLAVFVSTFRSPLPMRQRLFAAWMAPRGIVAAAVASVFAIRCEGTPGLEDAAILEPITFITIIATVAIYGATSPIIARKLGVAEANPQGILFAGAHAWAREVAALVQRQGYRVLLVDSNRDNAGAARMAGLPTYAGSILAERTLDGIDLGGIGRLLAVTPNEWVNVLTVHRFERTFGSAECYQLPSQQTASDNKKQHEYLHGRRLFGNDATYAKLNQLIAEGFTAKATGLTESFDYAAFRARHGESAVPLFIIDENGRLVVITTENEVEPKAGQTLISLVKGEP